MQPFLTLVDNVSRSAALKFTLSCLREAPLITWKNNAPSWSKRDGLLPAQHRGGDDELDTAMESHMSEIIDGFNQGVAKNSGTVDRLSFSHARRSSAWLARFAAPCSTRLSEAASTSLDQIICPCDIVVGCRGNASHNLCLVIVIFVRKICLPHWCD